MYRQAAETRGRAQHRLQRQAPAKMARPRHEDARPRGRLPQVRPRPARPVHQQPGPSKQYACASSGSRSPATSRSTSARKSSERSAPTSPPAPVTASAHSTRSPPHSRATSGSPTPDTEHDTKRRQPNQIVDNLSSYIFTRRSKFAIPSVSVRPRRHAMNMPGGWLLGRPVRRVHRSQSCEIKAII